jgi:hypothetical protein
MTYGTDHPSMGSAILHSPRFKGTVNFRKADNPSRTMNLVMPRLDEQLPFHGISFLLLS